jgi:hypothetical protein
MPETNRRQMLGRMARIAGAGIAAASMVRAQAPAVITPAAGPVPTWGTELRKLAPKVYVYQQVCGPG